MFAFIARSPGLIFLSFALAIVSAAVFVAASTAFARQPAIISAAVAFDMIVCIPLLYWWLVIRKRLATARTLIPIIALSLLAAHQILPPSHRGALELLRYLIAPVELALAAFIIWKARAIMRSLPAGRGADIVESLERVLEPSLGHRAAARFIAAEIAILYYAVAPRAPAPRDAALRFYPQRSAMLIATLAVVLVIETAGMHLLISLWSATAAWILTGLSAYTLLWVVGDYRAIARRPTILSRDSLLIRVGLRFSGEVPLAMIEAARPANWRDACRPPPKHVNLAAPATPNLLITFRAPIAARRFFGIQSTVHGVLMAVDQPDRMIERLHRRQESPGAALESDL